MEGEKNRRERRWVCWNGEVSRTVGKEEKARVPGLGSPLVTIQGAKENGDDGDELIPKPKLLRYNLTH